MRKIKKIGLFLLIALGATGLASCNKEASEQIDIIDDSKDVENENGSLSTISLDTSNTKTLFYLGEEFNTEGLIVKANYVKMVDGSPKSNSIDCTGYYLDTSAIDMNAIGDYEVKVVFRDGFKTVETSYEIKVRSSVFNEAGVEYLSGLEVKYENAVVKDILLDENFTFDKNKVTAVLHTSKMENGKLVVGTKNVEINDLEIDYSAVNNKKVDEYMIKYSYSGPKITINGKDYENKVTSYTIVSVSNPVVSIEKVSQNDTNFRASTEAFDCSDWEIKINRKVSRGNETVKCTSDLFNVASVCPYVVGNAQPVKVTLLEDDSKSITVYVSVLESRKQDIKITTNIGYGLNPDDTASQREKGRVQLTEDGKLFGVYSEENTSETRKVYTKGGADGLTFPFRTAISPGAYLEITLDSPAIFIPYMCAKDAEVEFQIVDENGNIVTDEKGNEVITLSSTSPVATSFNIGKAGKYKIVPLSKNVYFFGYVVATDK